MVYNAYFEIPIIDIPKTVSSLRLHPHLPGRQSENKGGRSARGVVRPGTDCWPDGVISLDT